MPGAIDFAAKLALSDEGWPPEIVAGQGGAPGEGMAQAGEANGRGLPPWFLPAPGGRWRC